MLKAGTEQKLGYQREISGSLKHGENLTDIRKKIGELLTAGKLEKTDAQALVHSMSKQREYRTAVALAKKSGLTPDEIFAAIKDTPLQSRLLTALTGSELHFPESASPLPESSDIAAQYIEQKFQQQEKPTKEELLAEREQANLEHKLDTFDTWTRRIGDGMNKLPEDISTHTLKLIQQLKNGGGDIPYRIDALKSIIRSDLRYLVDALRNIQTSNLSSRMDQDFLSQIPMIITELKEVIVEPEKISVNNLQSLLDEIRSAMPSKPKKKKTFYTTKLSGFVSELTKQGHYKESSSKNRAQRFSPKERAEFLRELFPNNPVLEKHLSEYLDESTDSSSGDLTYSQERFSSTRDSGDPKAKPHELAELSKPYRGMLFTDVFDSYNHETNTWSKNGATREVSNVSLTASEPVTITLHRPRNPIVSLPAPLSGIEYHQIHSTYENSDIVDVSPLKLDSEEVEVSAIYRSNEEGKTIWPKNLSYTIDAKQPPQALPETITLEELAKRVETIPKEERKRYFEDLPVHTQTFLQSLEGKSIPLQMKAIEAYSKQFGFYDFDNAQMQSEKMQVKTLKEQLTLMQQRLTELSMTENVGDRVFAGVCTDFQTLTNAMLRAQGIKTRAGTGYLVMGSKIQTTDSHVVNLVELPTEDGKTAFFEVDGTPSAGTQGSEKALEQLQRSAFQEELTELSETIHEAQNDIKSRQEKSTDSIEQSPYQETNSKEKDPLTDSSLETYISLTLKPSDRQQLNTFLNTLLYSPIKNSSLESLSDPGIIIEIFKTLEQAAQEPSSTDTNVRELLKKIGEMRLMLQKQDPDKKMALRKIIYQFTNSSLHPKIASIIRSIV